MSFYANVLITTGLAIDVLGGSFLALDLLSELKLRELESRVKDLLARMISPFHFATYLYRISDDRAQLLHSYEKVIGFLTSMAAVALAAVPGMVWHDYAASHNLYVLADLYASTSGTAYALLVSAALLVTVFTIVVSLFVSFAVVSLLLWVLSTLVRVCFILKDEMGDVLPSALRLSGWILLIVGFVVQIIGVWI